MKKIKKVKVVSKPKISFMDIDHRKYVGLEFDFEQGEEKITKKIISKIEKEDTEDAVVQIQIKIWEEDLQFLNLDKIKEVLEDAYYIRPIIPIINRNQTNTISEITIDMEPEEAIERFIDKYDLEDKEEVLGKAIAILRGEYRCI